MKKIIKLIPLTFLAIGLTSCGEVVTPDITPTTTESTTTTSDTEKDTIKYTISVKVGENYYPGNGKLKVILQNNINTIECELPDSGIAEIEAPEGEYYARLDNAPGAYVYDPNTTIVNTKNPNATINLYSKAKPTAGTGKDKFTNVYKIDNLNKFEVGTTYYYETEIKNASDVVYYEFKPSVAGTYQIESCVSMFENKINPKVLKYYAGPVASAFLDTEVDKGGQSLDGSYTKNFAFTCSFAERQLGNVQKFGIKAEVLTGLASYPVKVLFKITYIGDASTSLVQRNIVYAEDIYYARNSDGTYKLDSNGNKFFEYEKISEGANPYFNTVYDDAHNTDSYNKTVLGEEYESTTTKNLYAKQRYSLNENGEYVLDAKGDYVRIIQLPKVVAGTDLIECAESEQMKKNTKTVLDSTKCYLNEEDGIWYIWLDDAHTKSTRLITTMSKPTHYLEQPIDHLEDDGGKGVQSVSTGKYTEDGKLIINNYKRIVEAEITDCENAEGYVYVTDEIKNILSVLSNNNQYFFDGNGWCEQDGTYADEDSQWLFACRFYQK